MSFDNINGHNRKVEKQREIFKEICGKTAVYGQAFHRVAMPRLIKLQPNVNPIITISPCPSGALPTYHKQRSNWTSLIVGGARPLYTPSPSYLPCREMSTPPCRSRTFPFLCHHLPTPRRQPSLLPLRLWTQPPAQRNPSPATPHHLFLYFYLLYKPVYLL